MRPDIVGVIETAYRVDRDERTWLGSVLDASRPLLDRGMGVLGVVYDVSDPAAPCASAVSGFDLTAMFDGDTMREAFRGLPVASLRSLVTTSGCHEIAWERRFLEIDETDTLASLPVVPSPFGPSDMLVVNAADPTGRGCFLSANHRRGKARVRDTWVWNRLSAHLCAGLRLRRRLAPPEAVIAPDGRVLHAETPAKSARALAALRRAARAQERARGMLRRREPEAALDEWQGLIAARWTLREHIDTDGKRTLLAERNDPEVTWIDALTQQEQLAVAYASLGQWSELIAYDLGIAVSAVRVLLARAAAKAGVRTRRELVERFVRDRIA